MELFKGLLVLGDLEIEVALRTRYNANIFGTDVLHSDKVWYWVFSDGFWDAVDFNARHHDRPVPIPQYQLPIWLTTESYKLLSLIFD